MESLTEHVVSTTSMQQGSSLTLGAVSIPVPPANVDPSDYDRWFQEKTETDESRMSSADVLFLHSSVEREYNEAWYEI